MLSVLEQLKNAGFADLGVTDVNTPTLQIVETVAAAIGAVPTGPIETLNATPLGVKPANTYGGNFGPGELPLHTDLAHWHRPPRFVLLRCIKGSAEVSTRLLDARRLEGFISPALMRRALLSPRRRLEGKMYLLRMLASGILRWDTLFLVPQNGPAREVFNLMKDLAPKLPIQDLFLSHAGQAVLLDNWRVLHGRSSVPTESMQRSLDRAYLDSIENGDENTTRMVE